MKRSASFQPEIQGLRAVAVLCVLVFHLWPSALTGGYVGVDVFFVVSGYLITALLLKEREASGRISLLTFYRRRARRLLPAASLVLLAVALLTFTLPEPRWRETAFEVIASALYAQNWYLAWLSTDYLGADAIASPLKHFWSLSIEEQFYLFWPAGIMALGLLASALGASFRLVAALGFTAVVALSFHASVTFTAAEPEAAYFASHTRFWQLALGALLAAAGARGRIRPGPLSGTAAALGLVMIAVAAAMFDSRTAFPGYAALLPTLGAGLILSATPGPRPRGAHGALSLPPMQWLGDISYSLYLWHWPVIVFYAAWTGITPGLWDGLLLLAISTGLAQLSKTFVEDRFRRPPPEGRPSRALAAGAAAVTGCVLAGGAVLAVIAFGSGRAGLAGDPVYPGAMALTHGVEPSRPAPLMPALTDARRDNPDVYERGCHLDVRTVEPRGCEYGDPQAGFHVMLVGDSHAASWVPAFQVVAETRGWRLTSHTKSACQFVLALKSRGDEPYTECLEWSRNMIREIDRAAPDVLVITQSAGGAVHDPALTVGERRAARQEAMVDTLQAVAANTRTVIALRDNPNMSFDPPECVAQGGTCEADRESALARRDTNVIGAERLGLPVIDLSDGFCEARGCPSVIGNVLAWRDRAHFTATFARTLAPALDRAMAEALGTDPVSVVLAGGGPPSAPGDATGAYEGLLECSPTGSNAAFSRVYEVTVDTDRLSLETGDVRNFNDRFEIWNGQIMDGNVAVWGFYRVVEGSSRNPIALTGRVDADSITLQGRRGPRDCTFIGTRDAP